jgi:cytochrome c oxidase subunit IV
MAEHAHAPSRKPYFLVFGALMVLTFATYAVAGLDLGPFVDIVAMAIALVKGALVVIIFMHVGHGSRLTKLTAAAGFVWLLILFGFLMADYATREWTPLPGTW